MESLALLLHAVYDQPDHVFTSKHPDSPECRAQVVPAVKESLHKLQLDHLDLLLIHWPVTDQPGPELMPSAQV